MVDWQEIAAYTMKELGSPAGDVDVKKVPHLTTLCGLDRRLVQDGPYALFQGGVQRKWRQWTEPFRLELKDLLNLRTPRAIVDHIRIKQVGAAQAVLEKIEAHIHDEGYDLERTRCIALKDWWLRTSSESDRATGGVLVMIDCVCAFGPWIPPVAADEPAITGKADA